MTRVAWTTLEPGLTEQLIGVLLCRVHCDALRIRVSQGDGGIDVMVPVVGDLWDIYQIKYFATPLDDSRKAQIRASLKRIRENTTVRVRNWYLTLPLNPSTPERLWFAGVTVQAGFKCHWFGLDQLESLAARHADVLDYYLHDGRERLERSVSDLRALVGLAGPGGNQLVVPSDLREPLTKVYEILNRDDPHYRYEFEVGQIPPPSADDNRRFLVARVTQGNDEIAVTIRVFARYVMATNDAPIPLSFNVAEEDLSPEQAEAWQRTLRYGTPAEVLARNVAAGLPGGLGDTIEAAVVRIGPALHERSAPYRLRLGILDPEGRLLADAIMEMQPPTQGPMGGSRASGAEQGGAFDFESLIEPDDGTGQHFLMNLRVGDLQGRSPGALQSGIRFLSLARQPNRLAFGPEYGPLLPNPLDLPYEQPPVTPELAELIDSLAVIQRNVSATLVVPDLETLTVHSWQDILRAAALLRGETVQDTWEEQEIEYSQTENALDPEAPAYQLALEGTYTVHIGNQQVEVGDVVITWLAADLEINAAADGSARLLARPAMGSNTRLIRLGRLDENPPISITPGR